MIHQQFTLILQIYIFIVYAEDSVNIISFIGYQDANVLMQAARDINHNWLPS